MPKVLNPAEVQPYQTTNAVLAYCLYKAGVPFASNEQPCTNLYDKNILFELGGGEKDRNGNVTRASRFAGMNIEDAAKTAFEEESKGRVEFLFPMNAPGLSALLKAFDEQTDELKRGKGTAAELSLKIVKRYTRGEMNAAELLLRLACVDLKMNRQFRDIWKRLPPMVRIDNPGKARIEETTVTNSKGETVPAKAVVSPGFKIISLNLSKSKRQHIGLK